MPQTGPAALDRDRRSLRHVAAAAPWLLAAGLAVAGLLAGRPVAQQPAAAVGSDAGEPPAPDDAPPPGDGGPPQAAGTGAGPASDLLPGPVVADVLATARAAFGTAGLETPDVGPHDTRWPVETHIASVERVGEHLAVATVHGLVLERRAESWAGPHLRAVAVPLTLTPTPAVAGAAWPVKRAASVDVRPPPASPMPDVTGVEDLMDALTTAGWTVEAITEVAALGAGVVTVGFVGHHLEEQHATARTVWLHRSSERSVLLPHPTAPPGVPTGQETP